LRTVLLFVSAGLNLELKLTVRNIQQLPSLFSTVTVSNQLRGLGFSVLEWTGQACIFLFFPRFSTRKLHCWFTFFKKNFFSNDVNLKRRLRSSVVRKKNQITRSCFKTIKIKSWIDLKYISNILVTGISMHWFNTNDKNSNYVYIQNDTSPALRPPLTWTTLHLLPFKIFFSRNKSRFIAYDVNVSILPGWYWST
jgi:hypothetical protein